jgi:hypothetical protein
MSFVREVFFSHPLPLSTDRSFAKKLRSDHHPFQIRFNYYEIYFFVNALLVNEAQSKVIFINFKEPRTP